MLEGTELAVGGAEGSVLELHVMLERGGRQQLDTEVVGDHVGEVQAQLGVAAHGGLATEVGAGQRAAIDLDAGTVGFRIDRDRTGANDDVTGIVGVGEWGGEGERNERGAEQGLVHGGSRGRFEFTGSNGKERTDQVLDSAQ